MALQGTVIVNGATLNFIYIKARIGSISEVINNGVKKFYLNYNFEFKVSGNDPFYHNSSSVEITDLEQNPYAVAYDHLADTLNVSPLEV